MINSDENGTCREVFAYCWEHYSQDGFISERDRLGVAVSGDVWGSSFARLRELANQAQAVLSPEAFFATVLSSQEGVKLTHTLRSLLRKASGAEITDETLWRFLRCFVVLQFDFAPRGGRDANDCLNRAQKILGSGAIIDDAKMLGDSIFRLVAHYAPKAGEIDADTLVREI